MHLNKTFVYLLSSFSITILILQSGVQRSDLVPGSLECVFFKSCGNSFWNKSAQTGFKWRAGRQRFAEHSLHKKRLAVLRRNPNEVTFCANDIATQSLSLTGACSDQRGCAVRAEGPGSPRRTPTAVVAATANPGMTEPLLLMSVIS